MSSRHRFTFRQRAGRLNWKQLSSLDVDKIVIDVDVQQLQQVLDPVTFSEITDEDIKANSIDNINKLIQVMQYAMEYLLSHQESQYALIAKLNNKISRLKQSRERYYQENLAFREDIKTYQRQLHLLRKGITHVDPSQPYAKILARPGAEEEKKSSGGADAEQIVRSILDHEREARRSMLDLFEDQRRQFSREISNIVEVFRAAPVASPPVSSSPSLLDTELVVRNLQLQVEKLMHETLDVYKQRLSAIPAPVVSPPAPQQSLQQNAQDTLKAAALAELEKQLKEQIVDLRGREAALKAREEAVAWKEKNMRSSSEFASKYHNAAVRDQAMKKRLGALLLKIIVQGAGRRSVSVSFRQWFRVMLEHRDLEKLAKHGKMLLYANEKKSERELFLQMQLEEEQRRVQEAQTKYVSLSNELEAIQARYQTQRSEHLELQQTFTQLRNGLEQEKEGRIVLNAKFNTAQREFAREREELLEKIRVLEDRTSASVPMRETSIMTSIDLSSFSPNKKGKKAHALLAALPPEFARSDLDEEAMMNLVANKIESRNRPVVVHELAKRDLAKEIVMCLSSQIERKDNS